MKRPIPPNSISVLKFGPPQSQKFPWSMVLNLNLVTTVIGFGMSVTFIVFICARLICGRIRSSSVSRGASAFDIDLPSDDFNPPVRSINGLEPVTLAAMPTMKYNHEAFPSSEDAQCSICLEDYQEKEILRIMATCHHNFHLACIDEWLRKQSTCPICRLPLNGSFEAPPPMFGILREMISPVTLNEYSNRSVNPSFQQTDGSVSNHDIHDAIDIEVSHVESEIGT